MSDTAAPALLDIRQIAVNVHDLNRAIAFYRDVLGHTFLLSAPPQLAFFDCGGVRLMLAPPERAEFDHPGSTLYYRVADITASHAALVSRGMHFDAEPHMVARMPDHELWLAFGKDSEGNSLGLLEERRAS